jgi:hypothetical protein
MAGAKALRIHRFREFQILFRLYGEEGKPDRHRKSLSRAPFRVTGCATVQVTRGGPADVL